ncbi:MAG: Calx-beta domain-containing protein, partial [Cyanobacteriota bacterium]|nr:Calx-beta domain-containing protein [Cyanobacteriota bacterium]
VDSTAEVGSDYRKRTGTLTFQPGQTAKNLNVVVLGDSVAESDEFFWLGIVNPTNAIIEDNWGLGAIVDND